MTARLPLIDALKAFASQLIVLHHLAFYGPMSDVLRPWAPGLVDWLYADGRLAVQVFLVLGGFLAAHALAPDAAARIVAPLAMVGRRWLRLAIPCAAAIVLAIVASALARGLATLEHTPASPTLAQLLANLLLLQDLVGQEALSAGLWYVAIDLQAYALMVALLWVAMRTGLRHAAPLLIGVLTLASLLHFNLDPSLDIWALYFFGAYGLGALAWWAAGSARPVGAIALLAAVGLLALWVDPRSRIAVALATALLLAWATLNGALGRWPSSRLIGLLGRISFSVFLVHYPVCLVVNAVAARCFPQDPLANLAGIMLAWAGSVAAGALLYRWVELPAGSWIARMRTRPTPTVGT